MIDSFINFVAKEKLFLKKEKVLLCVSGGVDSVVMCELFKKAGFEFGIAHCNFQLRGDESDEDELFVEELAEKLEVEFHSVAFDTSAFVKKNKLSVQVAARQLRYQWFEDVREQFDYSYIATAHHRDDSVETFFINLIRGTGIAGLHGILAKQNRIIRPLLFTNKEEIMAFAKKHKLEFREDSSNTSDKYTRNKIRQKLIPLLKEMNPDIRQTIAKDIERLTATEKIYRKEIERKRSKVLKEGKKELRISINELKKLEPAETYLFEFLSPFGFNAVQVKEIVAAFDGLSGKQFLSATHRLVKDRDFLIVGSRESGEWSRESAVGRLESGVWSQEKGVGRLESGVGRPESGVGRTELGVTRKKAGANELESRSTKQLFIEENVYDFTVGELKLSFQVKQKTPDSRLRSPDSVAMLDFDKLKFPLEVRRWKKGDTFQPLGMKGKKKLSDFFIDKKLSLPEKENAWLLTSEGEIVWIIGMRMDDRFKVTTKTSEIYLVQQVFS